MKRSNNMRLGIILLISLFLSACGSLVNIDYDETINFRLLKTYKVKAKPVRVPEDTRINSPFMQQRVVAEMEAAFSNKGFKNVKQKAELEIQYFMDVRQEIETHDSGISIGFGTSGHHSAFGIGFNIPVAETSSYDSLVLTIDVVSAKSHKLIWRGSLAYPLYEGETPERYRKMVKRLVAEILKEFPPK